MAESMTYSSLVRDIAKYCERNDSWFLDQIPRFIMMAEVRIASESKPLGFLRVVRGTLSGPVMAKPARWRQTKSLSIKVNGSFQFLQKRTSEFCRMYWPNESLQDTPKYYADYDYEHYLLTPPPSDPLTFELQYYERPTPLDDACQVNWTTQYAPSLLLYASLMEAMPALKTSERIAEFQALYDRALLSITLESQSNDSDASS